MTVGELRHLIQPLTDEAQIKVRTNDFDTEITGVALQAVKLDENGIEVIVMIDTRSVI